jgi:hypothetical protein
MGLKMDGSATGSAKGHDKLGRLVKGHSEYFAKRRRVAERLARLVADYDPTPSQRMLLAVVAQHLDDAERARTTERRVLAANAANRLLRSIPRKQRPAPSLQELMAGV